MTQQLECFFEPMDTWFFRESRPQGSMGSSELGSVFPPPVRTLLGAVRTAIGDAWHVQHGTDWRDFENNAGLRRLIGFGDELGALQVQGPWLQRGAQRLYPVPFNLMHKKDVYFLMGLGSAVFCDLGTVRLPALPKAVKGLGEDLAGAKPAEGAWLTQEGWQAVLQGKAPAAKEVVLRSDLYQPEPRLGIGRCNQRGAVQEGLLYQTRHLRMADGVSVCMALQGLDDHFARLNMPEHLLVRLGGEGRQAMLTLKELQKDSRTVAMPALEKGSDSQPTAVLYALTPSPCAPDQPAGIPLGFERKALPDGTDVWEGYMGDVKLRIFCAITGRTIREGGWDLARHQARAVQSFSPAGSALYVTVLEGDITSLHGQPQGNQSQWGRGHYCIGRVPALA